MFFDSLCFILFSFFFFFFNDTATTEIYTLSLHDALPISPSPPSSRTTTPSRRVARRTCRRRDRKSTRLNSSHANISYAVFCLTESKDLHLVSGLLEPTRLLLVIIKMTEHG